AIRTKLEIRKTKIGSERGSSAAEVRRADCRSGSSSKRLESPCADDKLGGWREHERRKQATGAISFRCGSARGGDGAWGYGRHDARAHCRPLPRAHSRGC